MSRKLPPSRGDLINEKRAIDDLLYKTWDKFNIPSFHREAFLKCENLNNMK